MTLPPVAFGIAAGIAVALVFAAPAQRAAARLDNLRAERDALAGLAAGPPPSRAVIAPEFALVGSPAALVAQFRDVAARGGVLVERAVVLRGRSVARIELIVSGSPDSIIALADGLERGRPLVRFRQWRMVVDGGTARLTAETVTPWR